MITSLDIPDDPAEVPKWLESILIGPNLGEFVREIEITQEVVRGELKPTPSLDEILLDSKGSVLESGLVKLPYERIRLLLQHPRSLLALQELVFIEGGEYWQGLSRPQEMSDLAKEQFAVIQNLIAEQASGAGVAETDGGKPKPQESSDHPAFDNSRVGKSTSSTLQTTKSQNWFSGVRFAAGLAAAASVLFFFVGNWNGRNSVEPVVKVVKTSDWGWERAGILDVSLAPDQYLNHLANLAGEWFNQQPASVELLEDRLRTFRKSCDTLIDYRHDQLPETDRAWLVDRCKAWAKKLDEKIAALAESKDSKQIQIESDALINNLMVKLRDRRSS